MGADEIRLKIKEIISRVTDMDAGEIGDEISFREDLDLDSLSLLEIAVDVDYEFKLNLPEEELSQLESLNDAVTLVQRVLAERSNQSEVA